MTPDVDAVLIRPEQTKSLSAEDQNHTHQKHARDNA
jgi:hypothetical protein